MLYSHYSSFKVMSPSLCQQIIKDEHGIKETYFDVFNDDHLMLTSVFLTKPLLKQISALIFFT